MSTHQTVLINRNPSEKKPYRGLNLQLCIDKRHTTIYGNRVTYDWDEKKNSKLKKERGISFEEILLCINENKVIKVLSNPNNEKYPRQYMYLIHYNDYIYAVPFVENKDKNAIFLKTIYPTRRYTKLY